MTESSAARPDDAAAALAAWAIEYAPEHVVYAAKRGHVVTSAVLDTIAQLLATALNGRALRPMDELIKWSDRSNPRPATLGAYASTCIALVEWRAHLTPPAVVEFAVTRIVRVEEQTDVRNPESILKYSGVIISIACSDFQKRYVLVNLEIARNVEKT